ncbi:Pentatricopeptide repeat [Parasponia andersonii]|uniref:Pentatricopeptide repeat n=1 Tax=Parasponia andersonii TaxID=3476 RepID=A0A2P5DR89_PARAD|nr:Pentatricopeptide repeat [Parasponia andersonii]
MYHTFNVWVDMLGKEGEAAEAQRVIDIMIQRGIRPDEVTYNSLMDGYCLRGEIDEARKVFDMIRN